MRFQISFIASLLLSGTCFAQTSRPVTFDRDVAPIVYQNCAVCHRAGEVAPFSLLNYSDVKKHADDIVTAIGTRYMPPWKPDLGGVHFVGERRLSEGQISTIGQWVKSGMAQGDAKDLPAAPTFPTGWSLGEPDLVVKFPKAFNVKADGNNGRDIYRCFVVPLGLTEDKFVRAVEFRPSNRRVVHHAIFFLDSSGAAAGKEKANTDGQIGYSTFGGPGFVPTGSLGGWAPGASPTPLPDGWGRMLRKGSDLVIQIHFHPDGKDESEQSSMGIYFTKGQSGNGAGQRPAHIVAGAAVKNRQIDIPAGDANYVVTAQLNVPVDVDLIGMTPHAHLICKDMQGTATLPDGQKISLIHIADWDFNWQGQYRLADPLRLPAGTVIDMKYTYDNSENNIRNPNSPPARVRFGEQTTDEMAFLFLEFSPVHVADWLKLLPNRGGGGGGGGGGRRAALGGN